MTREQGYNFPSKLFHAQSSREENFARSRCKPRGTSSNPGHQPRTTAPSNLQPSHSTSLDLHKVQAMSSWLRRIVFLYFKSHAHEFFANMHLLVG